MKTSKQSPQAETFTLACHEMPQARFDHFGTGALSDTELIALILQAGLPAHKLLPLSTQLMAAAGSLHGIMSWQPVDFQKLKGIGQAKARQLAVLVEISRRMMQPAVEQPPVLNRPEMIMNYMRPIVHGLEVEKFWVVCLNRRNRLKKLVEVTSGTATTCLAHPREVFRSAIQQAATAIVCIHNHPSGDPAPSAADIQVTRQLRETARAVDIMLLDHVILGNVAADPLGLGYYSFRSAGVL